MNRAVPLRQNVSSSEISEAIALQREMAKSVSIKNDFKDLNVIAGIDVSYDTKTNRSCAAIVLMQGKTLEVIQTVVVYDTVTFPYIPGLLSFREVPVIEKAFPKLAMKPDILMIDGQGIAHPRRLGIAAHLGVLLDVPAIGVAKSRLVGSYREPGNIRGDSSILTDKQEKIGTVLRSKSNVKPLFVSPGHRIDHETAVAVTLYCLTTYRLPEPTRIADKLSRQLKLYAPEKED